MIYDNNKLKTKNQYLKAELEKLKAEIANATENNTEEFEAAVVLQEYEAEHASVESVSSKLVKINFFITPVLLECKDSMKTHKAIKYKQMCC